MKESYEQLRAVKKVRNQQGEEIFQMVMIEPKTGRIISDPRLWHDALSAGQTFVTIKELEEISRGLLRQRADEREMIWGIDETPRLREEKQLEKKAQYQEPSLQEGVEEEVVLELVQEGGIYE